MVAPRARRRAPRWRDVAPFLDVRRLPLDPVERRLARCLTIDDLERLANRRVPSAVWDYVYGGAEAEVSLRRNRDAFARVEFVPTAFDQVGEPATTTSILGREVSAPIVLAPTGYSRLSHHLGEAAAAAAAADAGLPYTLATYATTSIDDIANTAPHGNNWFQFYLMKDRSVSLTHLEEAKRCGYTVAMVTIDTTVTGQKRKDIANGFAIPPRLTARTLAGLARHPHWVANILTTEPLRFATFPDGSPYGRWGMSNQLREQALRPADITWLKERWQGPVVVKGALSARDAVAAVEAGADGVVVSNHGGRQLDRTPAPLDVLPEVAAAIGDRAEVYLDSGVRSGADIAAALALGARAVLIGRPYLYGLMVGGKRGVDKALGILTADLMRTMCLLGTPTIADLTAGHARVRPS